jgi:hypothetical protein
MAGCAIAFYLLVLKFFYGVQVMSEHGPLMIFAAVLLLAGVQLVGLGLLGEMQVRHYHEPSRRAPYSVSRVVRSTENEQSVQDQ